MLQPLLASILAAGTLGAAPSDPAPPPSLTTVLAAASAAPTAPPQAGYDYGMAPTGWVSFGASFFSSDISQDTVGDPDDDSGLGGEIGLYGWQGEMGLGLELGLIHSTYVAVGKDVLLNPSEDVDVWRGMLGVRLADRGSGDRFLPWLRGGFLYRFDYGDDLREDGAGFYLGAGFDFVLIAGLAASPQVMYQQSGSVDSEEWIGTLALTYLF